MGFAVVGLRAASSRPGYDPFLAMAAAIVTGMAARLPASGSLVVYAGLSSLIATLGMNYMLRGLILIITEGKSIALLSLTRQLGLPDLLQPALGHPGADLLGAGLRHLRGLPLQPPPLRRAGPGRRRQPGQRRSRWASTSSASASRPSSTSASARRSPACFSAMINFTWWPTAGDGYLLPALASVFVGGTPDLGRHRHRRRRRDRRADRLLHPVRHHRGGPDRLLRPVLQRPDHRPGAARPSLEPGAISLTGAVEELA